MNVIGRIFTNFRDFYNEINSATLTGAIDVIIVQQPDDTFLSSPFHVRFGKMGVLRSREKVVSYLIPSNAWRNACLDSDSLFLSLMSLSTCRSHPVPLFAG